MMPYRITLPTIGKGTMDDPFRVEMPHYRFVSSTPDNRYHTIDVDDADVPDSVDFGPRVTGTNGSPAVDIRLLSADDLQAWYAHLDGRYREKSGLYRPKG